MMMSWFPLSNYSAHPCACVTICEISMCMWAFTSVYLFLDGHILPAETTWVKASRSFCGGLLCWMIPPHCVALRSSCVLSNDLVSWMGNRPFVGETLKERRAISMHPSFRLLCSTDSLGGLCLVSWTTQDYQLCYSEAVFACLLKGRNKRK